MAGFLQKTKHLVTIKRQSSMKSKDKERKTFLPSKQAD